MVVESGPVVFVHSSWRTGSTFIWSRFRRHLRTTAFYEIFHEQLATLRAADVRGRTPDAWASKHPSGAPYLTEYIPLLREEGGVRGYDPAMAYERFIPQDGLGGALTADELDYVAGLIGHAQGLGKIPVLTETRGLGRIESLKAAFGGRHVLNYRNAFHQWASFCEQEWLGGSYFFHVLNLQLQHGRHDPTIRRLVEVFGLDEFGGRNPRTFYLIAGLHLYLYGRAASCVDLVLDLERLAENPELRSATERRIAGWGIDVDLSPARRSFAFSLCDFGPPQEAAGWLKALGDILLSSELDAQGKSLVERALGEIEAEMAAFDFHAGPLRRSLLARLDASGQEADRWREEAEALSRQNQEKASALAIHEGRLRDLEAALAAGRLRGDEASAQLLGAQALTARLEAQLSIDTARNRELQESLDVHRQTLEALRSRPLFRLMLDRLGHRAARRRRLDADGSRPERA